MHRYALKYDDYIMTRPSVDLDGCYQIEGKTIDPDCTVGDILVLVFQTDEHKNTYNVIWSNCKHFARLIYEQFVVGAVSRSMLTFGELEIPTSYALYLIGVVVLVIAIALSCYFVNRFFAV